MLPWLGILGVKERCAEGFGHPFGSGELSVDPLGSPTKCHRAAGRYQKIFRLTFFVSQLILIGRPFVWLGTGGQSAALENYGKLLGLEQPLGAGHAEAPLS
jgi:hypothetical protein